MPDLFALRPWWGRSLSTQRQRVSVPPQRHLCPLWSWRLVRRDPAGTDGTSPGPRPGRGWWTRRVITLYTGVCLQITRRTNTQWQPGGQSAPAPIIAEIIHRVWYRRAILEEKNNSGIKRQWLWYREPGKTKNTRQLAAFITGWKWKSLPSSRRAVK